MRLSTKQGLRTGIGFGFVFGFMQSVAVGALGGLIMGIVGGAMFGLAIGALVRRKERRWDALRAPFEAEGVEHHGPASCAIGHGYLMLTTQRLVWFPTAKRDENKKIIIARPAIAKVGKSSGLGAQIRIGVTTGESVQFMVTDRKVWLERLSNIPVKLPEARVVR